MVPGGVLAMECLTPLMRGALGSMRMKVYLAWCTVLLLISKVTLLLLQVVISGGPDRGRVVRSPQGVGS